MNSSASLSDIANLQGNVVLFLSGTRYSSDNSWVYSSLIYTLLSARVSGEIFLSWDFWIIIGEFKIEQTKKSTVHTVCLPRKKKNSCWIIVFLQDSKIHQPLGRWFKTGNWFYLGTSKYSACNEIFAFHLHWSSEASQSEMNVCFC